MSILAQPEIYKYNIDLDGNKTFLFTFDIVPNSCTPNYQKSYEMVVTKNGSVVSSPPWIILNSDQTSPSMTVNSSDFSHRGNYIVTVNSKLFNESAYTPSFALNIFLTPC